MASADQPRCFGLDVDIFSLRSVDVRGCTGKMKYSFGNTYRKDVMLPEKTEILLQARFICSLCHSCHILFQGLDKSGK